MRSFPRPELFVIVLVVLPAVFSAGALALPAPRPPRPSPPSRPPPPFWFGVATSSYQIEGASQEGNRGPSIWDTFSHSPGKTARGETGDVAADFYHRYAEDVRLARELGVQKFRLSLSWPRIFPNRTLRDDGRPEEPNEEGLAFYERVLDALDERGIEPLVTLYHWDLPQALQDGYGGWTSPRIVDDFRAYARVVFERLGARRRRRKKKQQEGEGGRLRTTGKGSRGGGGGGGPDGGGALLSPSSSPSSSSSSSSPSSASAPHQIRYWTTLNEPWVFCFLGHTVGTHAPGLRSAEAGWACARNALLAHLAAAEEFENVFFPNSSSSSDDERQKALSPLLSVNVPCQWAEPWSSPASPEERDLAREAMDFDGLGIFADVLFKGQWPPSVLSALARARESGDGFAAPPPFSEGETAGFLRHRPGFFALNFYTSYWARPVTAADEGGSSGEEEGEGAGGKTIVDPSTGLRVRFAKEQTRPAAPDPKGSGGGGGNGSVVPIGLPGAPSWLFSTPWAMRSILNEVNERYGPEEIIVTENGFATRAEQVPSGKRGEDNESDDDDDDSDSDNDNGGGAIFEDGDRVDFYRSYLASALDAVALDGVPLSGFCAWSLLDNFEWADGYSMRFGVVRVDFGTQERTVKRSALWLGEFFRGGGGRGRVDVA